MAADTLNSTLMSQPHEDKVLLPGKTWNSKRKMRQPTASLWGTLEFKLYYLLYLIVIPNMAYTMYYSSSPSRPEYSEYEGELSPGWLFGRKVDLTDGQWDTFRSHFPAFFGAMFGYVFLNHLYKRLVMNRKYAAFIQDPYSVRGFLPTMHFPLLFSLLFVSLLSGTSTLIILALVSVNYFAAKLFGGHRFAPFIIWTYNMAMLFMNEKFKGYEFEHMSQSLAWLDSWRGILHRWDITFNITMLRMVSFSIDYHWRVRQQTIKSVGDIDDLVTYPRGTKERTENSCFLEDYCFANYWVYLFYPPLYLTGPICTFNNFVSQMRSPACSITRKSTALYGLRLLFSVLLMEIILHTVYSVAISKLGQWETYSVYEISLFGYMRLTFIWLKLLIIWRFARFWAMADGIETIENMGRCMSNNYSLQQFWRDWHCSYNKWLVRYVYIPLGGRSNSPWNIFIVFTFVALWHDLTMQLLSWAWIIAILFLPEGITTWYFNRPRWNKKPYFRFICSLGGACNIIAMMVANLIGFGDEGIEKMLGKVFSRSGAAFLAVTFLLLNVHLQVMFEWREHQYRREYANHNSDQEDQVELRVKDHDTNDVAQDVNGNRSSPLRHRPASDNISYS